MSMSMVNQSSAPSWSIKFPNLLLRLFLLVTAICVFVPLWPYMPQAGLDPSWVFALNQAVEQKLVFGRDIIFTFGPYSSIYTKTFHPATDGLMLAGSLILGTFYGIGALYLTRAGQWYSIAIFILILGGQMGAGGPTRDALLYSYPLMVAVCAAKLVEKYPSGIRNWAGFALAPALMLPFGLLVLVKGTLLVACTAVTLIIAGLFAQRRNWPLTIISLVAPVLGLGLFWSASGQQLADLPVYIASMVIAIAGYTEAFALTGSSLEIYSYLTGSVVLLSIILVGGPKAGTLRVFLLLVFLLYLFLAFKGGFVRHDGHANIAADALLLAALFVYMFRVSRSTSSVFFVALVAWAYIQAQYPTRTTPELFIDRLSQTYSQAWHGLTARLTKKDELHRRFAERLEALKNQSGYPPLEGTTDIYSFNQAGLIASGNIWSPRPVFQSYFAVSPELAERNRQHLLGDDAPDNLIFRIEPIDGRYPATEDGPSWPVILSQYTPIERTKDYLLLKRNGLSSEEKAWTILDQGIHFLGEEVPLPDVAEPVFVRIQADSSMAGKLATLLFKPSPLQLNVTLADGVRREFRVVSGMISSEFLLSPLVTGTADFALLFGGTDALINNKLRSFSLEATSMDILWEGSFAVSFLKMDLPPNSADQTSYIEDVISLPGNTKITVTGECRGHIDRINDARPSPNGFFAESYLDVSGWLVTSIEKQIIPAEVLLVLVGTNDRAQFFRTVNTSRPDVAAHFNMPGLERSGFHASIDISGIRGAYSVGLARLEDEQVLVCRQFSIPGVFQGKRTVAEPP